MEIFNTFGLERFNQSISQGANNASNLMCEIKSIDGSYLGFNSLKGGSI